MASKRCDREGREDQTRRVPGRHNELQVLPECSSQLGPLTPVGQRIGAGAVEEELDTG